MRLRLALLLALAVIASTVIGTLSHELGHAVVAWGYGYKAVIHYGFTSYPDSPDDSLLQAIALRNHTEIRSGQRFPGEDRFRGLKECVFIRQRNITWGGPLQTMLTGTIGVALIGLNRSAFRRASSLRAGQWLIIFLALFWLRQAANFLLGAVVRLVTGSFPVHGDEFVLARYYGLPVWSIAFTTCVVACLVATGVWSVIPARQRPSFLLAFVIGAPLGYLGWLSLLGPVLLP